MGTKSAAFCSMCILIVSAVNAVNFQENFMLDTIIEWRNYSSNLAVRNEKCEAQLATWEAILVDNIQNGGIMKDNWAWRMLDASNKLNAGILTGNTMGSGNMDECMAIDEEHEGMLVKGKYCYPAIIVPLPARSKKRRQSPRQLTDVDAFIDRPSIRQSQVFLSDYYYSAVCIPHECALSDLVAKSAINPFATRDDATLDLCQTTDTLKEWNAGAWSFIAFVILVLVCVVASTTYDCYIRKRNLKPASPITLAFSFYTNGEKLLKLSQDKEQISCLHGIRTLSMMLVMAGHRYSIVFSTTLANLEQGLEWTEKPYSMYVQQAPIAVDSFLFLSGVLMAYGFMKSQSKPKARFNVGLYYLHRYLRLTPAVAVLWFFYVTLYQHASSGPLWPTITTSAVDRCFEHPYSYFLYIQNFVNPNALCMIHTWYLSVDMQLFILSPIILIPMVKYPKYAGHAMVGLIILSVLPPILITYFKDIVAYGVNYNDHFYYQPHTRMSPWLVGILLGYILYQTRDKKFKINQVTNLAIWAFILGGMVLIQYFACDMNLTDDILSFAFFNGLHRMLWAVGLSWIVFACHKGYGGIINWFLSIPVFEILGKLSYSMYLLHAVVQMMIVLNKRTPFFFTEYELMSQCFGDIITISGLALLYCLMFESPMVVVEKIIFGAPSRPANAKPANKPEEEIKETIDA